MAIKRVTLLGTSGVGKTTLSALLSREGWYHYSGDYRIATTYLAMPIQEWLMDCLNQACSQMDTSLAELYRAQAVALKAQVSIDNLAVVSQFIGKLGQTGYSERVFRARQQLFRRAELNAMLDVPLFIERAQRLGYDYFMNDAGGSVGELDESALFAMLQANTLIVYIHAEEELQQELLTRALNYPKPICYHPDFLDEMIKDYAQRHQQKADEFDSDDFIRFVMPKMMAHRRARYLQLAQRYGVVVNAKECWQIRDHQDFQELLSKALGNKS
ncbi:DEAD/DEAH box helicase family protein [Rappaport israeli]|uniref:hypothetical protein n=1 Tax=Rappaport israeli TaxID=1839807 RepID=UPI0009313CAD|nr:hypothetical protein [Rappaport israeli]